MKKSSPRQTKARQQGSPAEAQKRRSHQNPSSKVPVGLLQEHYSDSEAYAVLFQYYNPAAKEVFVAGSFNGWEPFSMPMTKEEGGTWANALVLRPGAYEYRLIVDGQWQDDPMSPRYVANPFGGLNSVVEVKSISDRTMA